MAQLKGNTPLLRYLRFARERRELTQSELARISSHQSVISEIERDILDPPLGVFLKLCQALDI